jgi:serine O-acetyltransferase
VNCRQKIQSKATECLIARACRHPVIKEIVVADMKRWIPDCPRDAEIANLSRLFMSTPEFRSLFYYRVPASSGRLKWLYPPLETLYIYTQDIGPGLFIQHGFATIIAAKKIGAHCWINQQVTIGYSDAHSCPTIGNHVIISAGALVIGGITIGDRVHVGAGAVVVRSIPSDCTVVGNPARIIRRHGIRVDQKL